jgi:hypothetical protein
MFDNMASAFDPSHPAYQKPPVENKPVPQASLNPEDQMSSFASRTSRELFQEAKETALVKRVADLQERVNRSETSLEVIPNPEQETFDVCVKLNGKAVHAIITYQEIIDAIRTDSNPTKFIVDKLYPVLSRLYEQRMRESLTGIVGQLTEHFKKMG